MELPKFETLDLSCDSRGVLTVALNRPEKRNAFSGQMIADLHEFAQKVSAMDAVRVVVLRGRGRVFCAGGDLEWMKAQIAADRVGRMAEEESETSSISSKTTFSAFVGGILIAFIFKNIRSIDAINKSPIAIIANKIFSDMIIILCGCLTLGNPLSSNRDAISNAKIVGEKRNPTPTK